MERWFLTMAAAATAAAALMGCGGQPARNAAAAPAQPAPAPEETAVLGCESGFSFSDHKRYFRGDRRRKAVVAGPITLLWLNSHGKRDLSRPRALYTKVLVRPHATTTLAVAPADRDRVRLSAQPPVDEHAAAGGDPAIVLEGCRPRVDDSRRGEELGTGYAIAVMVDSPGCATFHITPKGDRTLRRRVAFGVASC